MQLTTGVVVGFFLAVIVLFTFPDYFWKLKNKLKRVSVENVKTFAIAILSVLLIWMSFSFISQCRVTNNVMQDYINIATNAQFQAPEPPANLK